jgi:prepilin-type N-terminal cleavage/methylation domain-containing protein
MVTGRRSREQGMTLVELMVTMVISSIIAASTFLFFAGQQRIYETQTKLLNIQQNLWAAMEVVSRYTRAAGSGMFQCVKPASFANTGVNPPNGSRIQSTWPSPSPLPSAENNKLTLAAAPATGARAHNAATGNLQWIPPLWIVNNSSAAEDAAMNIRPGTDILTVAFGNRTSGTDVDAILAANFTATNGTITLKDTNASDMFRPWEFVLLLVLPEWAWGTNPVVDRGCTLLQITSIPQAAPKTTLDHGASAAPTPAGSPVWNPAGNVPAMLPTGGYAGSPTEAYSGVRNFGALTWVSFFIQQIGSGTPALMMRQWHINDPSTNTPLTQILAEGIEDLQVSFACDTGTLASHDLLTINGQLDEGTDDASRRTDEWWNNVPNDTLPAAGNDGFCNLPTAVRLTLVARTLTPDDLIDAVATGNGPLDIEDHHYPTAPSRPTDQFRRRVLTTTIFPRNNKPL